MRKNKKKGFTLIELLTIFVILTIVLAITVPVVANLIESARKKAFATDARSIIRIINYKKMDDGNYDIANLTKDNLKNDLNVNIDNYESIDTNLLGGKVYITIVGQNKWEGLISRGTLSEMEIVNNPVEDGQEQPLCNMEIINLTADMITFLGGATLGEGDFVNAYLTADNRTLLFIFDYDSEESIFGGIDWETKDVVYDATVYNNGGINVNVSEVSPPTCYKNIGEDKQPIGDPLPITDIIGTPTTNIPIPKECAIPALYGYEFNTQNNTIVKYYGTEENVVIPNSFAVNGVCYPVLYIGDYAFAGEGGIS